MLTHFFHNKGIIATLFHRQELTFGQTQAPLLHVKECTPRARGYKPNDDTYSNTIPDTWIIEKMYFHQASNKNERVTSNRFEITYK